MTMFPATVKVEASNLKDHTAQILGEVLLLQSSLYLKTSAYVNQSKDISGIKRFLEEFHFVLNDTYQRNVIQIETLTGNTISDKLKIPSAEILQKGFGCYELNVMKDLRQANTKILEFLTDFELKHDLSNKDDAVSLSIRELKSKHKYMDIIIKTQLIQYRM
ncbi:leuB [Acrasis kona]|uniref:LeuB n=1 Tax=Acrasis kona TaxID=1008807 RepID=A0AAW2YLH3_9EUKA